MRRGRRRLSLRTKTGYGAVELGMSAAEVMLLFYLLEFYTKVIGLRAELAGFALALAMIWDAITDPVMGGVSDRTRSRMGKRRPYIILGSVLLAFGIVFIFSRPDIETQAGKFFYLLGAYMLVNTSMTIVAVPHAALAGEVSFDRNERTELFGWRLLFRTFGFMVAVLLPGLLVIYFEERLGVSRTLASRWIGISILATGLVT
ncbi:MAG TPA: MFS transporter, partial [Candidatus Hydrogenedentes bacterium]|nr:MFS transporter [Candidatus Hydrogenedentota bacterium]